MEAPRTNKGGSRKEVFTNISSRKTVGSRPSHYSVMSYVRIRRVDPDLLDGSGERLFCRMVDPQVRDGVAGTTRRIIVWKKQKAHLTWDGAPL